MSKVEVRESRIKGKGVFAHRKIRPGEVILHIDDSVVVDRGDPILGKLIGSEPDPCDYLPDGRVILMQSPERYINHGCDPNVYIYTAGKDRFILARREISAGEELLFDYAIGLVGGDWLDCLCGSPYCRGRHRSDFFALPLTKQLEYLPYLSVPFVQVHWKRIFDLLQSAVEQSVARTAEGRPLGPGEGRRECAGAGKTQRHVVESLRSLYREPEIRGHFSNPYRNVGRPDFGKMQMRLASDFIANKGHVLEVGCGGGQETFLLLEAGYRVTGIDIVPEFIKAVRAEAERRGFTSRCSFHVVDGFSWPLADGTCDAVWMMTNFLDNLPSRAIRKTVFTECRRVLAAGGAVLMQGHDRTHPGTSLPKPDWAPAPSGEPALEAEWLLTGEPGVVVNKGHVCRGDANAQTPHATYTPSPRETWDEVSGCGLRVVRMEGTREPDERTPDFILVAVKDPEARP